MKRIPEMLVGDRQRFQAKISSEPNDRGCLLWMGTSDHKGYGVFSLSGKSFYAHRIAYLLHRRKQPLGLVCHRCDTPRCVNGKHLYDGTPASNMRDKMRRGRARSGTLGMKMSAEFGARVSAAKLGKPYGPLGYARRGKRLSHAQVHAIRALKGCLSSRKVARIFGLKANATVLAIWHGKLWSDLL